MKSIKKFFILTFPLFLFPSLSKRRKCVISNLCYNFQLSHKLLDILIFAKYLFFAEKSQIDLISFRMHHMCELRNFMNEFFFVISNKSHEWDFFWGLTLRRTHKFHLIYPTSSMFSRVCKRRTPRFQFWNHSVNNENNIVRERVDEEGRSEKFPSQFKNK